MPRSSVLVSIPRRVLVVFLASFYILAFVLSPYWTLVQSESEAILILIAVLGLGGIWCYCSTDHIQVRLEAKPWILLGIVLMGMLLLNSRMLTSVIPWRGDEGYHIAQTRDLMNRIPLQFAILAPVLFSFVVFAVAHKWPWLSLSGVLASITAIVLFFQRGPFKQLDPLFLLRYPYVNYWFYAIGPIIAKFLWNPHHEVLYRIVPVLSATAVVWIFLRNLPDANWLVSFLWGLAIATMPVLIYYSSILYIELPAVVLMVLVCLHARNLLNNDLSTLKQDPAWYALMMLGFIKETVAIFLLCFLACRVFFSWRRQTSGLNKKFNNGIQRFLVEEFVIAFCVLFPYLLYMVFRVFLINTRTFHDGFSSLLDPSVYRIIALSFIEQFGAFVLFFLGGLFVLIRKKYYPGAAFAVLLLFVVPLFFSADTKAYTGYSRFNLFVLPSILFGSVALVTRISKWGKIASAGLAFAAIAINLAITPIYPDGTKVPYWGNYLVDTSEHYYPYDQALLWLKDNSGKERILISSMFDRYYLGFYFAEFDWHPVYDVRETSRTGDEAQNLTDVLTEAEQDGFNLVLFQIRGDNIPKPGGNTDFCLLKVFANQAHELALFARSLDCRATSP